MSDLLINVTLFLSGVTMATFAAAGLFFIRFWRTSRDRFFLLFALSCWALSAERIIAMFAESTLDPLNTATESMALIYLVRLFAFSSIAVAIWEKNRRND